MNDLLTELAGAAPGKAIDRKIALSVGWHRVEPRYAKSKNGAWIAPEDFLGTYSSGAPILDGTHGTTVHRDVPDFTTSLDAALTLVPEGAGVCLVIEEWTGQARVMVGPNAFNPGGRGWAGYEVKNGEPVNIATPALALCIAALKARQTDE